MVTPHRPPRPQRIVVKANRAPRTKPPRTVRCVICDAVLASDHGVGDMACSCHQRSAYNPRHDADLDRRVLTMLVAGYPYPVNVLRALNTSDRWAIRDCVNRWRRRGVTITGVRHVGYKVGAKSATVGGGGG